jgi:DNA-binding HxlR family transcriptional regulator
MTIPYWDGVIAPQWTMCVLEVPEQNGTLGITRITQLEGSVSQRILTKTLRQHVDLGGETFEAARA